MPGSAGGLMEAWVGFSGCPGASEGFTLENNVATFESESPQLPSANSLERLEARAGAVGLGERADWEAVKVMDSPAWSWCGCGR